jgi:HSP20 family protein
MRALMGWDPFRHGWDPLRHIFPITGLAHIGQSEFTPQFEVKETRDSYIFKADLPGVNDEDVDISMTGNRLTISGSRESEQRDEGDNYFVFERSSGTFSRSFTLPEGVDTDQVKADLRRGVLTVEVPKKPENQPKKISLRGVVDRVKGALGSESKDKPSS